MVSACMRRALLLCTFAPYLAHAQAPPAGQDLRVSAHQLGHNLLLKVEAMPPERFTFRPAKGAMSVAELVADLASRNDRYCAVVGAIKAPPRSRVLAAAGKDALVARLRETINYCEQTLATVSVQQLSEDAQGWNWEYVIGLRRSRAFVATQTMVLWGDRDGQLALALRLNGLVPPRECIGGGDCESGENLCKATTPGSPGGRLVLDGAPYSVRSDDRGPYLHSVGNATVEAENAAALILTAMQNPDVPSLRSFRIDLTRPVPRGGGTPLGVVSIDTIESRSTYLSILAQWYTEPNYTLHSLLDIPVGTTVRAEQLDVSFAVNGVPHVLQMGPQPMWHCLSDGTTVHGEGTSRATIYRPSASQWIVDLPPGSIGRLFDVHLLAPNAVDKGLYYVSLHFAVFK